VDKTLKRSRCLVCGEKIPLIRHMNISVFNGAECVNCHSYMRFSGQINTLQLLLLISMIIFIGFTLGRGNYILGIPGLLLIIFIAFFVSYFAKYKIDPDHAHRSIGKHKKSNI